MDFLDPKIQRRHTIQLLVGYVFVTVAILIGTTILLYRAYYGYGLGKGGQVVQNSLLYVSSTPAGAEVSLNGKDDKVRTDTRQSLVSGTYNLSLSRSGYHGWQRQISLEGASVAHYDYPFLFPNTLTTSSIKSYESAPRIATQSPNQRWLVVQQPNNASSFDVYDLSNPKIAATSITLPSATVTNGTTESWQAMEWSTDNDHLLLQHTYDGKNEFIMLDRGDPTKSINLSQQLGLLPTKISLRNKKYDQYYIYDATTQALKTASLSDPTPVAYLDHVLDYQSYGSDIMLYASSAASSSSKVSIDLLQNGKTYNLREVNAGTTYLLNLTQYSGSWYVALGASSENKVYVYKNPVTQLNSKLGVLVPIYILKTPAPTYLAFSNNAQFIVSENGTQFSVYDAELDEGYTYDTKAPLDAPQAHASWMDGDRLTYASNGKLIVFDYDHANPQTLMTANSGYLPFFAPNYKFVDVLAPLTNDNKVALTTTSLRTLADQ